MSTRALDIVTILHALNRLGKELNSTGWNGVNSQQKKVFSWLVEYREKLSRLTDIDAKASQFCNVLNDFLEERGFDRMVDYFDPTVGIAIVSILDKLIHWLSGPGVITEINVQGVNKSAFELPSQDVNVYTVDGYSGSNLLELKTKTLDTLWLFLHFDNDLEGLEMVELSWDVMSRSRRIERLPSIGYGVEPGMTTPKYLGAKIPMIDFDIKPDISWLIGADTYTSDDVYFFINQARQQFRMRMDETGARVKVATVVGALRNAAPAPIVFVIDQPFYGWLTQEGLDLPIACFFADVDSMNKPAGSLEEL